MGSQRFGVFCALCLLPCARLAVLCVCDNSNTGIDQLACCAAQSACGSCTAVICVLAAACLWRHPTRQSTQPQPPLAPPHPPQAMAQVAGEDDVARFMALTGSSTDQAAFMLEATHGNMEQAVQMYLGEWLVHTYARPA